MAIVYPGGIDNFSVPTLPEDTSLSSAGTSTRNHTESHEDLGKAIMALEVNAAQLSHTHSGTIAAVNVTRSTVGTVPANDVQTIVYNGSVTAGSYTLTLSGLGTTSAIAWNASTSTLQAALVAKAGTGNVTVGGAVGSYTVTFGGSLASTPVVTMVLTSSLIGGGATVTHVTVGSAGANEVQVITISGGPTGGTFLLTPYGDSDTTNLAYNVAEADVQTALEVMSTIGSGNVVVTGVAGEYYTVAFQGALANLPQQLIAAVSNLTGGTFATPQLEQVNTHLEPDTDTYPSSLHHTLGPSATQASAGNHVHDYRGPSIINKAFEICTSSARPEAFPGKMIWEVDTNRARVWAQFPGERIASQGVYSEDTFDRTSTTDLGSSLWSQWYQVPGSGKMATPSGVSAAWIVGASVDNRCIAQRINSADRYTLTNDQVITFDTNAHVADWSQASKDNPTSNDVYFRMSDDGQTYIRAALTYYKGSTGSIMLAYTTSGPTGEQLLGQLSATTNTADIAWQLRLVGNKFEAYMGVEYVGAIMDNQGVTINGYKGWGIGMTSGLSYHFGSYGGQSLPNEFSDVTIADAVYYGSSPIWQLLPMGDTPRVGLGAGVAQEIHPTGSVIEWDTVVEDNFGLYNPSLKTAIVVSDPGVYFVHASIAWSTNISGDHAATVIMVNDIPTYHMHWEFVRGYTYTPGFSQTVDVSAYIRLGENDRVGIAAAHNGASTQFTGCKKHGSYSNITVTQTSRFFLTFHSA